MTAFQPGQRVQTSEGPGTVMALKPSRSIAATYLEIELDGSGAEPLRTYRLPEQVQLLETSMTTTTEQPAKKTRKKKAEISAAPAPAPSFLVGDLVTVDYQGEACPGVVLGVQDGGDIRVLARIAGEVRQTTLTHWSLKPRPTDPASFDVPFEAGDRVRYVGPLPQIDQHVTWTIVLGSDYARLRIRHEETEIDVSHGHLRIWGRVDLEQAKRDVGLIEAPMAATSATAEPTGPASEEELDGYLYGVPESVLYRTGTRVEFPLGVEGRGTVRTTGTVMNLFYDERQEKPEGCLVAADGLEEFAEEWERVAFENLHRLDDQTPPPTSEPAPAQVLPVEATPSLPSVPDLAPGTLGILQVPLHQLVRSGCNVRSHYDPAAVEELAASLAAEGQLENCTGRWNAEGQVEVVAGETRRRAWLHLQEQGRVDPAQPVLVHVRELSDAQALRISATENMRRRSMTPLEECEAMLRMNEAGDSVEAIQVTFGYKTAQPVVDRILVARNLLTAGREALDGRQVSLAQAFVIARAPGKDLQASLLGSAKGGHNAEALGRFLTRGQFLVQNAKFDVEKSSLEIKRDLFDAFEPYFLDKGKALNAQLQWANAQAEKARKKGKHPFVAVESGESAYSTLTGGRKYLHNYEEKGNGLIYFVSTTDGAVSTETRYRLKGTAAAKAVGDGSATPAATERAMPESAYLEAHHHRARALRESLLGSPELGLILTVHGLIMGGSAYESQGKAGIRLSADVPVAEPALLPPALGTKLDELAGKLQGLASRQYDAQSSVRIGHLRGGVQADSVKLFALLSEWSQAELLDTLNVLVATVTYDWVQYRLAEHPASPLYSLLAAETGAPALLAQNFKLTDEWLRRYPRHELVALAEEAGLGRALVEDCSTLKEMRARLLEHAERLHAEGFVPRLVRFPEVG